MILTTYDKDLYEKTLKEDAREEGREGQMKTDMNKKQKNTRTFLIKIMDQQNGTWQGSVTWVEEQREQHFRSALELLKLIDGALDNNVEIKIEE